MAEAPTLPAAVASHDGAFKSALACDAGWGELAKSCLESLQPLPAGANLGFLYVSDALAADFGSIATFLKETTGIAAWTGTVGYGVVGSGVELFDRPAISVMVCALPPDCFYPFGPTLQAAPPQALAGTWPAQHPPVFGVLHADPRTPKLPELIHDLSAGANCFFVGGLSASRGELPQLAGGKVEHGETALGASGLFFDPTLQVATGLTQGCSPIGPYRTVTASDGNVVMAIDERPALEVFKDEIGELLARDLRRIAGYIHVAFPIRGSDTGDYLVRNLVGVDPERGWIAVGDLVEPGTQLMFVRRDHSAALHDLERMLEQMWRRAPSSPRAALYYSCVARGPNLFGPDSQELRTLWAKFGSLPLTGFFANGEISNDRLYGYTGVLTLLL